MENHSMNMNTFVVLLTLVVKFQISASVQQRLLDLRLKLTQKQGLIETWVPDCLGTNMDENKRKVAIDTHNRWRSIVAKGNYLGYPPASNMKLLTYDCGLENKSFEIATYNCNHTRRPNFDCVGSNNAGRVIVLREKVPYVQFSFDSVLREWMQTAQPFDFTNSLNISYHNASEIPFLQIVHGPTTKVGCAFHVCPKTEDSCDDEDYITGNRNLSIVCSYGESHINRDAPLYTNGTPCDGCGGKHNSKCIWGALCNTTKESSAPIIQDSHEGNMLEKC
ncbi:hypothetical protein KIN20_013910 [Parelaphostrongylus tenuis]|uniref:SCP domain-containing protein n=1 Tax=Parelaphostrongylus tenuis TaxID=148309 RepID=A0AAD5MCT9_PARTN|nr:hypothetical protein KIN20_013910 [Parelaphostrongylus tenuis]